MIAIFALYLYLFTGLVIAVWFCFFKVTKVDAAAAGSSFWFKLIIAPGVILLWPFVLFKLAALQK